MEKHDIFDELLPLVGKIGSPFLISNVVIVLYLFEIEPLLVNVDLVKHIIENFTPHVYVFQSKFDLSQTVIRIKGRPLKDLIFL